MPDSLLFVNGVKEVASLQSVWIKSAVAFLILSLLLLGSNMIVNAHTTLREERFTIKKLFKFMQFNGDKPWILAIALLFSSISGCLFLGAIFAKYSVESGQSNIDSLAGTIVGLTFALVISGITIWTLWQTKKISRYLGQEIKGFPELIEALTASMNEQYGKVLVKDDLLPSDLFRIYFLTANPFLGFLSDLRQEKAFTTLLENSAALVKKTDGRFKFEIICCDLHRLTEFHRGLFPKDPDKVERKTTDTNDRIKHLRELGGIGCVTDVDAIFETQFMIVGNSIFEWILDRRQNVGRSEIFAANRRDDYRICEKYIMTFEGIKAVKEGSQTNVRDGYLGYENDRVLDYDKDITITFPACSKIYSEITSFLKNKFATSPGKKPISVLDLGMGTGINAQCVLDNISPVHFWGVDLSEAMLNAARNKLTKYLPDVILVEENKIVWDNLRNGKPLFIRANFDRIPFPTNLDLVIATLSIHHHPTLEAKLNVIDKVFHSLKKNGLFVYADLFTYRDIHKAMDAESMYFKFLEDNITDPALLKRWVEHHRFSNKPSPIEDIEEHMVEIGFKNIKRHVEEANSILIIAQK